MRRVATIGCGAVLALAVLAGCGSDDGGDSTGASGDSGGDYCSTVEDVKGDMTAFTSSDTSIDDMRSAVDRISEAAQAAPDDVGSAWDSLHSALDDMVTKLEDTGIPTDEPFGKAAQQAMKKDKQLATEIRGAMSSVQSVNADADKIEKQVKDDCDIDLSDT